MFVAICVVGVGALFVAYFVLKMRADMAQLQLCEEEERLRQVALRVQRENAKKVFLATNMLVGSFEVNDPSSAKSWIKFFTLIFLGDEDDMIVSSIFECLECIDGYKDLEYLEANFKMFGCDDLKVYCNGQYIELTWRFDEGAFVALTYDIFCYPELVVHWDVTSLREDLREAWITEVRQFLEVTSGVVVTS